GGRWSECCYAVLRVAHRRHNGHFPEYGWPTRRGWVPVRAVVFSGRQWPAANRHPAAAVVWRRWGVPGYAPAPGTILQCPDRWRRQWAPPARPVVATAARYPHEYPRARPHPAYSPRTPVVRPYPVIAR